MANNNFAALPQYWANLALRFLFQQTPVLNAVNRQFSPKLAKAGEQVNAYRAKKRLTRRKKGSANYQTTDAVLEAVPVVLNQLFYDSFIIDDEEESLTIPDLTSTHLVPSVRTIAQGLSRSLLGVTPKFLQQGSPLLRAGKLGGMTQANSDQYILEAEEILTTNLAPNEGLRTAIVHQSVNTKLMGNPNFSRVDAIGADKATVRTGQVGVVYNTAVIMSQDVMFVYGPKTDTEVKNINNVDGYEAGEAGELTVDGGATAFAVGEYVVVESNGQPTYVSATSGATGVTLNEELKYAAADNDVVTHYTAATVDGAYDAKEEGFITIDGHAANKGPQVGQIIAFGTGANRREYVVIEIDEDNSTTTSTEVLLNEPLEIALADNDAAFPGPKGAMCPVFHKDAVAFVSRPMVAVDPRKGAMSAVANYQGVGIRVVMQYNSEIGGTRVNLDILAGISVLDVRLMAVMLA